jgi:hypothetical protein
MDRVCDAHGRGANCQLGDLDIDGRMIFKWISIKWLWWCVLDSSGMGLVASYIKYIYEPSCVRSCLINCTTVSFWSYAILFVYSCSNGPHAAAECVCQCCIAVPVCISCKWCSHTAACCAGSCFCGCRHWSWASYLENRGKFCTQCLEKFMCVNCVPSRRKGSKAWGSHIRIM